MSILKCLHQQHFNWSRKKLYACFYSMAADFVQFFGVFPFKSLCRFYFRVGNPSLLLVIMDWTPVLWLQFQNEPHSEVHRAAGGPWCLRGSPLQLRRRRGHSAGPPALEARASVASAAEAAELPALIQVNELHLQNSWLREVIGGPELSPPAGCLQEVGGLSALFCSTLSGVNKAAITDCWRIINTALSLNRYYEYIFGLAKKQGPNKSKGGDRSELTELQVWITSADSECEGFPSVTSDESCESLPQLTDAAAQCWTGFTVKPLPQLLYGGPKPLVFTFSRYQRKW